jgi:hypothetical protein
MPGFSRLRVPTSFLNPALPLERNPVSPNHLFFNIWGQISGRFAISCEESILTSGHHCLVTGPGLCRWRWLGQGHAGPDGNSDMSVRTLIHLCGRNPQDGARMYDVLMSQGARGQQAPLAASVGGTWTPQVQCLDNAKPNTVQGDGPTLRVVSIHTPSAGILRHVPLQSLCLTDPLGPCSSLD